MDERALIAAACGGDAESFGRLIHRHQDMAYDVAYRLLGQADAAADATQEAVLAAYRALPALQGTPFRTWLLRMLVDVCRERSRPEESGLAVRAASLRQDRDCTSGGDGPARSAGDTLEEDLVQAVESAIARLPLEQRVLLVLADVQGLSYEEIAQVTGAAPAAVGRRLASARARLRDRLHGHGAGTRRPLRASSTCEQSSG